MKMFKQRRSKIVFLVVLVVVGVQLLVLFILNTELKRVQYNLSGLFVRIGNAETTEFGVSEEEIFEEVEEILGTYPRPNDEWMMQYPDLDVEKHPLVSTPLKEDFACVPPIFESSDVSIPSWAGLVEEKYSYRFKENLAPGRFLENGDLLVTCDPTLKPAVSWRGLKWLPLLYESNTYVVSGITSDVQRVFIRCNGIAYAIVRAKPFESSNFIEPPLPRRPHILLVLVDCISRYHFVRSMPETRSFIAKFGRRMFNFTNTNTIGLKTTPNKMGMFGGISKMAYNGELLWENSLFATLREKFGYISMYGENVYPLATHRFMEKGVSDFDYDFPFDTIRRFKTVVWPEKEEIERSNLTESEANDITSPYRNSTKCMFNDQTRRMDPSPLGYDGVPLCLGRRYSGSYLFDYYASFRKVVDPEYPTIGSINIYDPHGDQECPYVADTHIANNLLELEEMGLLDDTLVIILSDHGKHYGVVEKTARGRIEKAQPLLTMIFPGPFLDEYPEVQKMLRINEDRLVTPIDLYCTLRHFPNYPSSPNAEKNQENCVSLLSQPVPTERTCDSAGILPQSCFCDFWKAIDISIESNLKREESAAQKIVEWMDGQVLEKAAGVCKPWGGFQGSILGAGKKGDFKYLVFDLVSERRSENPLFEAVVKGGKDEDDMFEVVSVIQTTTFKEHIAMCVDELEKTELTPHFCECLD